MRSSLLLLLFAAATCLNAEDFTLTGVSVPPPSSGFPLLSVETSGTLPSEKMLMNRGSWHIYAALGEAAPLEFQVIQISWKPGTQEGDLIFHPDQLHGHNPHEFSWNVIFDGPPTISIPKKAKPNASESKLTCPRFSLGAAKGKEDADLYLFGSFTAGYGTKPLYVIDAKFNWLYEFCGTGWFAGAKSSLSTNTNTQTPVNRSQADPDFITGSFAITKSLRFRRADDSELQDFHPKTSKTHRLTGLEFDLRPVSGEFSRKYPASDLLTKGFATLVLAPWQVHNNLWLALYPTAGYEVGSNLNKPSTLFQQPVDLSRWNTIARAAFIGKGEIYLVKAKPAAGDIFRFTLDASYQPRVPFTQEPFVNSEYVSGKRTSVVRLGTKTRHEVESGINYNFSKYASVRVQYRWGSLPPLFAFVDHQVTIGLTLKASQNH